FREHPRLLLVDVAVPGADDRPRLVERLSRYEILPSVLNDLLYRVNLFLRSEASLDLSSDELMRHSEGAVQQVAKIIPEVGLVALEQRLVSEIAVAAEHVFAEHKVAQRIR